MVVDLARAIGAQKAQHLARPHDKAQIRHRRDRPETLGEVLNFDHSRWEPGFSPFREIDPEPQAGLSSRSAGSLRGQSEDPAPRHRCGRDVRAAAGGGGALPPLAAAQLFLMFGCMLIAGRGRAALCPRSGARLSGAGRWAAPRSGRCAAWWRWRRPISSATGRICYIPWAVMVLTVTGAVGGLFGQLDALMKAFIRSLR